MTDPICLFELILSGQVSSLFPRRVLVFLWEVGSPGEQLRLECEDTGCLWDESGKLYNSRKREPRPLPSLRHHSLGGWDKMNFPQQGEKNSHFLGREDLETGSLGHRGGKEEETTVGGS